jgi:hypothetical protein
MFPIGCIEILQWEVQMNSINSWRGTAHRENLWPKVLLLTAIATATLTLWRTREATADSEVAQLFAQPLFRYAIVYNDPAPNGVGRDLHVLMDPTEFNEANLRSLFGLLAKRFKSLPGFTVYIETSLQDIQTPEEREGPGYSEVPGNSKGGRSPAATIRHSANADTLYIYSPSRATDHPTKIDLRAGGPQTE